MNLNTETFKPPYNYNPEIGELFDDKVVSIKPSIRVDKQLLKGLSLFQRILLITNGSVTALLEHYLDELILVNKIYEKLEKDIGPLSDKHKQYISVDDMPVLNRHVFLQGQASRNNLVYAESTILINNLPADFRSDLLVSCEPIGKLWSKHRLETYKALLVTGQEKADSLLADHFNMPLNGEIMFRTYNVYTHGKIIMIITEKFPSHFFRDEAHLGADTRQVAATIA